ncbi:MAG: site-specific integrase [Prevotellaceae bacterium]|jgi:integrase|nr:site-specific integrase [Prevotellaceae bacterium]
MPRKSSIIIYPFLNERKGDLSKQWYVEYQYRVPNIDKPFRFRIYEGIRGASVAERRKAAKKIIAEKTAWLKAGLYLQQETNTAPVYADELSYRQEARLWNTAKEFPQMKKLINDYLEFVKKTKSKISFANIQSKMRLFVSWLESKNYIAEHPKFFKRAHIIDFINDIVEKYGFSKVTVNKYKSNVQWLFDYFVDAELIEKNPVYRISNNGVVKDCAAQPFSLDEREMLRAAIEPANPQLWLACKVQFYCALRPGNELRLMKIKWIDFDNKQIRVPCVEAKNSSTEIVDIPDILFADFVQWKLYTYPSDFYVFGKEGIPSAQHWGKNHFRMEFVKYRDKLGIPANRKFYSWKHTGAISLIQNGAQPYDLMEHLRHKDFATTEKYLKKRVKNPKKRISQFVSKI